MKKNFIVFVASSMVFISTFANQPQEGSRKSDKEVVEFRMRAWDKGISELTKGCNWGCRCRKKINPKTQTLYILKNAFFDNSKADTELSDEQFVLDEIKVQEILAGRSLTEKEKAKVAETSKSSLKEHRVEVKAIQIATVLKQLNPELRPNDAK